MPARVINPNIVHSAKRPWTRITQGLVRLGRYGVCGMAWQWQGPGPRGIDKFTRVMNQIPVATNKAFNTLWKNRESVCDELIALFDRADKIELEEFNQQVSQIFAGIDLVVMGFPNNHFAVQQGYRVDGHLIELHKEEINLRAAVQIFQKEPNLKALVYQQFGLDLFKITEPQRKAMGYRWEEHDYGVTGRIVIEEINSAQGQPVSIDWMVNRRGRRDYHISRQSLESINGLIN